MVGMTQKELKSLVLKIFLVQYIDWWSKSPTSLRFYIFNRCRNTCNHKYKTSTNVLAVTLSAYDNAKSFQQLKSGFKRKINWHNYQSKAIIQAQNQHLDYLINPSFQGINRCFVLSFENNVDRTENAGYFFRK